MTERTIPDQNQSLHDLMDRALADQQMSISDLHRRLILAGIDVSYTSVHKWVTGKASMSVGYAHHVCEALSLDPSKFLLAAALPRSDVSPNIQKLASLPPSTDRD